MSRPDARTRAEADLSQTPPEIIQVKSAFAGLMNDLSEKLQHQEERIKMLDRKYIATRRPALAHASADEPPHIKAFNSYVRRGDDDGLRHLQVEGKAMSIAVAGEGGYLVDPQTADTIRSVLQNSASLRQVANVVTIDSNSFDVLIDHADLGAGWAAESGPVVETDTPAIERINIQLHELNALPKASQRLLDDSAFDIEGWLAERIGDKFSRAEGAAFILGDGIEKPKGFLNHPLVPNDNWIWGSLGYVPSGADGEFSAASPADAIVDLIYSLGSRYRANGTFVMNSKTTGKVRKLKDTDGRFLWSDGLTEGEPARLMGYKVLVAEDMPDIATDAPAIAFGDFQAGYTIAERPDLRILRDPFSAKPHVLFYATKRVGGDVTDYSAIKVLKFSEI
jgi:HK97 family phage major capsid protein